MLIAIDFDNTITVEATCFVNQKSMWSGCEQAPVEYCYKEPNEIRGNLNHEDEAKAALQKAKEQGNVIIISNNSNEGLIKDYLFTLLGEDWKDIISEIIIGSGRFELKMDRVQEVAKQREYSCDQVVLIDDSFEQCKGAAQAGMNCIRADLDGVQWGKLERREFDTQQFAETSTAKPSFMLGPAPLWAKRSRSVVETGIFGASAPPQAVKRSVSEGGESTTSDGNGFLKPML